MSQSPRRAKKWTCDQCGMSAGRIDGGRSPLPGTWDSSAAGRFCLSCRRERAADAVLESVPSGSRDARAKLRRTALIEFEVRRTPDRPDGTIAKACRTSVVAVTKARSRLRLSDSLPPSKSRRAHHREAASR